MTQYTGISTTASNLINIYQIYTKFWNS